MVVLSGGERRGLRRRHEQRFLHDVRGETPYNGITVAGRAAYGGRRMPARSLAPDRLPQLLPASLNHQAQKRARHEATIERHTGTR